VPVKHLVIESEEESFEDSANDENSSSDEINEDD